MGTWGAGIFDNDEASDHLSNLLRRLIGDIEFCFIYIGNDANYFIERLGDNILLPTIDIYITLCNHYGVSSHLTPEITSRWRRDYLRAFDKATSKNSDEFTVARRQIITDTFERLDSLHVDV